jgi:peptidoglycan/xylan/chitin deacetylase (PgdA/CDA1 family)
VEDRTWNHPNFTTVPLSQSAGQIDQTQNEIHSFIGVYPVCVLPPYDAFNATVLSQMAAQGLTTTSYSIDSKD